MSYWLPSSGKLFLPPPTPVSNILNTDDFVTRTDTFYHASSERLLNVGHPYFELKKGEEVIVPKVSGSQFRVFRLQLPDPNKFTFQTPNVYNPETQRLVWALKGIEICRGQPLGIGVTGHPSFNKFRDAENLNNNQPSQGEDDRVNTALDPKQVQLFIVGCTPCEGEHWDVAESCQPLEVGACPPLQLVNTLIQDGEMCDIGFGNINNKALQATKSDAPLDIVDQIVKYPDFLKMSSDLQGNSMFFYAKREQLYLRHLWARGGTVGEEIPPNGSPSPYYLPGKVKPLPSSVYFGGPSGSLVSSDQQIFNRPFWIQRAQGNNNGVCWHNQLFVTAVDSTRGTNFTISVPKKNMGVQPQDLYKSTDFNHYLRHVEEWELSCIMQLCIVDLKPETLAHLHNMDPRILETWNLGFIQPPTNIEDQYRFIKSLATKCPGKEETAEKEDPYAKYKFWDVNLTERFSSNLEQYSLGRKFLFQIGKRGSKRPAPKTVTFDSSSKKAPKRRRKNA